MVAGSVGPLVSAQWLQDQLQSGSKADLIICDVRWGLAEGPKRDGFAERRIAGARFVDLDTDLSSAAGPQGRHPLPTPEAFADAMGALGISNSSTVIAYDDAGGGLAAARLWFMLDAIGVAAAVLDGGITEWVGPFESGPMAPIDRVEFVAAEWPTASFVDIAQVEAEIEAGRALELVDARSAERFAGVTPSVDPRPGHIPGAVSLPWPDNLEGSTMATPEVLARRFDGLGDSPVAYCGSGVTACHNLLAMRVVGRSGRLYAGSWSQWAADPDRPAATST